MKFSTACINTTALSVASWLAVCMTRFAFDYHDSAAWFLLVALAAFFWSWTLLLAAFLLVKVVTG